MNKFKIYNRAIFILKVSQLFGYEGIKTKVSKKATGLERKHEKEEKILRKDKSMDIAVIEEVFDKSTLMLIYKLLNHRIITSLNGVVDAGKESRIYHGVDSKGNDLALKIYLTSTCEWKKGMQQYIKGDPRFKSIKHGTRSLIYDWAKKEFSNLIRARAAEVRVPKPIYVEKNILVMEFIGKNGIASPILKNKFPKKPKKMYQTILENIKNLYNKAELVHADLSEYNIINNEEEPVIIDMSQTVHIEHPKSNEFLKRDLKNIGIFFNKFFEVDDLEKILKRVTSK